MKISKSKLRKIVKETLAETYYSKGNLPASEGGYEGAETLEEMTDALYKALKGGRVGVEKSAGATGDGNELYIMTGETEGITVQILRRGR